MKIAGLAIDDGKLPIFKRQLDGAGCEYAEHPSIARRTLTLPWTTRLPPHFGAILAEAIMRGD